MKLSRLAIPLAFLCASVCLPVPAEDPGPQAEVQALLAEAAAPAKVEVQTLFERVAARGDWVYSRLQLIKLSSPCIEEPEPIVVHPTAEALRRLYPEAPETIAEAAANHPNPAARFMAVLALAAAPPDTPSARKALRHALQDEKPRVQLAAAYVAGVEWKSLNDQLAPLLASILSDEAGWKEQDLYAYRQFSALIGFLEESVREDIIAILSEGVETDDPEIRLRYVEGLGRFIWRDAVLDIFIGLLKKEKNKTIQFNIVSKINNMRSVPIYCWSMKAAKASTPVYIDFLENGVSGALREEMLSGVVEHFLYMEASLAKKAWPFILDELSPEKYMEKKWQTLDKMLEFFHDEKQYFLLKTNIGEIKIFEKALLEALQQKASSKIYFPESLIRASPYILFESYEARGALRKIAEEAESRVTRLDAQRALKKIDEVAAKRGVTFLESAFPEKEEVFAPGAHIEMSDN